MFRINVWHIVIDHIRTLRELGENKMYGGDKITFFYLPLFVSLGLIYFDVSLKPQVGNLIKALAIFGAFLFNLLSVIHSQLDKIKLQAKKVKDEKSRNYRIKFAREIHSNITFCILLSIILIPMLLVYDLAPNTYGNCIDISFFKPSVSFGNCMTLILRKIGLTLTYWMLFLFGLTLLMVVNRVYILMREEETTEPIEKKKKKKKKKSDVKKKSKVEETN